MARAACGNHPQRQSAPRFYQDFNLGVFKSAASAEQTAGFKPVRTEVTEFLSITVRLSLVGGFVLALPVILYNAIRFVAPGLTPRERKSSFRSCPPRCWLLSRAWRSAILS